MGFASEPVPETALWTQTSGRTGNLTYTYAGERGDVDAMIFYYDGVTGLFQPPITLAEGYQAT